MEIKGLLVSLAATATLGAAEPGVIEVDLIFPRNESYAPTPLLPIVLGFQDSNNASGDLGGLEIGWQLLPYDGTVDIESDTSSNITAVAHGMISPGPGGSTKSIYVSDMIEGLTLKARSWYFVWQPIANCTGSGDDDQLNTQRTIVYFTTDDDAPAHDIVPNDCADAQPFVMKTTAKTGTEALHGTSDPYCGYDDGPLPRSDPCKAKISPAEAKNIEADATYKACHEEKPIVTCPASADADDEPKGSGAGVLATPGFMLVAGTMAWTWAAFV